MACVAIRAVGGPIRKVSGPQRRRQRLGIFGRAAVHGFVRGITASALGRSYDWHIRDLVKSSDPGVTVPSAQKQGGYGQQLGSVFVCDWQLATLAHFGLVPLRLCEEGSSSQRPFLLQTQVFGL